MKLNSKKVFINKKGKAYFVSGGIKRYLKTKVCPQCKEKFYLYYSKCCTTRCGTLLNPQRYWKGKKNPFITGEKNSNWKGGKRKHNCGYVEIGVYNHPYSHSGYVLEHRFVMEQHLGRYLKPEERVHHNNGIKNDNRIENLRLFKNESEHQKHHHSFKKTI